MKNHVLVGFASEVLTKEGLNDCIIACENNLIGPNRSDPCRSGMFFETVRPKVLYGTS